MVKIYMITGLYQDTLTNSAGCDSIVTLKLKVKSASYSKKTILVTHADEIEKEFSYTYNGKEYKLAGNICRYSC